MGGIDNQKVEHYGPIEAAIDAELQEVRLTVKRGKDPLGQTTLEKCVSWAVSRCKEKYPNYQLVIYGQEHATGI